MHLRPTLLLGGLLAAAIPASASASAIVAAPTICADAPTSKPFAAFGDFADYSLAPDGDFEAGAGGWVLTNAAITDGNETAGISTGGHSLLLGASATGGDAIATSPEFCVTQAHPTFRYVVRATGSAAKIDLTTVVSYHPVKDPAKVSLEVKNSSFTYGSRWVPSAFNPLASLLNWGQIEGGQLVRISFRIPAKALANGSLQLDSIMVDPVRRS